MSSSESVMYCCRGFGLYSDDAHGGSKLLHGRSDSSGETATTNGHDDRRHLRHLLEDLERQSALTQDDQFVVIWRYESVFRRFFCESQGPRLSFVVIRTLHTQVHSVFLYGFDFGPWRVRWHNNCARPVEKRSCPRNGLAVITGRNGQQRP